MLYVGHNDKNIVIHLKLNLTRHSVVYQAALVINQGP